MQLLDFVKRFQALSDEAFRSNFGHPFLLETGGVLDSGPKLAERKVFLLRPRGGRGLVIGRAESSDIRLEVSNVSNRHAVLLPPQGEESSWCLLDTRSTNGTFLEGVRVKAGQPTPLVDQAAIRFGPEARYAFLESETLKKTLEGIAKQLDPGSDQGDALGQTDPNLHAELMESNVGQVPDETLPEILLNVIEGGDVDPLPLLLGDRIVIGRTPKNADFVLPHKNVSRKHAEIERRAEGVFLRDLGSSNGTFVGSTRVGPRWLELLLNKHVSISPYVLNLTGPEEALGRTSVIQFAPPLEGSLAQHSIKDILSDIERGQSTGLLKIEAGTLRGLISFRGGEPVDARTKSGLKGDEALRFLFALETGDYWLDLDAQVSEASRTIQRTFAEFALEAFFDEGL